MKKILALILVLAMVAVAFGCAAPEATTTESTTSSASSSTSTSQPAKDTATEATQDDTAAEAAPEKAVIALILPLSDVYASTGACMKAGAEYCYQYFLEEAGGFQNKNLEVEFLVLDLKNDADLATILFEQNVADFHAAMGCYKTAATIACMALATKYEKPFINIISTADTASALESDYAYNASNSLTQVMVSFNEVLEFLESRDDHEYSKAALIYTSDDNGVGVSGALKSLCFKPLGWEVIVDESLQVGQTTDASTAINKVKNSGADICANVLTPQEAILVQKQFREYKCTVPVFAAGGGYFDPDYFSATAGAGDYVVSACTWQPCVMPYSAHYEKGMEYFDLMQSAAGVSFNETGAAAWLACGILLQAMDDAASLAGPDLAAAIKNMNLPYEHFSNVFTCYPTIHFGNVEGITGTPIIYNANMDSNSFYVQSLNSVWELAYWPGHPDFTPNSPIVWPHEPYSEENTYQG